jgi:hypothetical protein
LDETTVGPELKALGRFGNNQSQGPARHERLSLVGPQSPYRPEEQGHPTVGKAGHGPLAPLDQRTMWAYIFGTIWPKKGRGAGLVLPYCDTEATQDHLAEISQSIDHEAHAVLILDQAGWHVTPELKVPNNITLLSCHRVRGN